MVEPIQAGGGTIVFGPMDIFESGRMLQFIDPTGAQLGLWQPKDHIGAGIVNTVGAMCWNELLTKDAEAAQAFYGALFDWKFFADENGYIMIQNRGRNNGAMMQMDASFGEMPSVLAALLHRCRHWTASIERAGELGGTIIIPKTVAPGAGHFAYLNDPAGAFFYIIQLIPGGGLGRIRRPSDMARSPKARASPWLASPNDGDCVRASDLRCLRAAVARPEPGQIVHGCEFGRTSPDIQETKFVHSDEVSPRHI